MARSEHSRGQSSLAYGAAAVVGSSATLAVIWLAAPNSLLPSASADPLPNSCLSASSGGDDDYGQFTVTEAGTDGDGTRADVWFTGSNMQCQKISTLGVYSPTGNGFWEFGWILGWWGPSSGDRYLVPTMFAVGHNSTGASVYEHVWTGRTPTPGKFHNVRASDLNENTYWGGFVDGDGGFDPAANMDFANGSPYVNWERGHPDDEPAGGEFKSIEEHTGSPGNEIWNYTDSLSGAGDDPEYDLTIDTNDHHVTIQKP